MRRPADGGKYQVVVPNLEPVFRCPAMHREALRCLADGLEHHVGIEAHHQSFVIYYRCARLGIKFPGLGAQYFDALVAQQGERGLVDRLYMVFAELGDRRVGVFQVLPRRLGLVRFARVTSARSPTSPT